MSDLPSFSPRVTVGTVNDKRQVIISPELRRYLDEVTREINTLKGQVVDLQAQIDALP